MGETILKMTGITKVFAGVIALSDVHFELKKGEIHALIGENGAGKSTLMKILFGLYHKNAGEIFFKGKKIEFKSPKEALKNGITMIHQEISLVPHMTVAENIWLGREKFFTKAGFLNLKKRYEETQKILDSLNLKINPKSPVKSLSIAEMQLVELARAVSYNSDIIIMDEPTSALTTREVNMLFGIAKDLACKGVSIVFISHKLEEIFSICNRLTVLRDGHFIATEFCSDVTNDQLIKMIVDREISEIYPTEFPEKGEILLEVKNLCSEGIFEDINFHVRTGEILGFAGLMGAGRTEIIRAVFGLDKYTSGEVFVKGELRNIKKPQDAVRYGIGMVTEDRLRTGSIYSMTVVGNTTIASLKDIANKLRFYKVKKELKAFKSVANILSVKYSMPKELIGNLSGGNQQKVIIARWLLKNVDILILDEPTRGIDVGSKSEIYKLVADLAARGMAIIMISSELPELIGMSDRIIVVRNGRFVFECDRAGAKQEELMTYAFDVQDAQDAQDV